MTIPPRFQVPIFFITVIIGVAIAISIAEGSFIPAALLLGAGIFALVIFQAVKEIVLGIQWNRPVRFLDEPIPGHWEAIIAEQFPLFNRLKAEEKTSLLRYVQLFLSNKNIEGAGGLEVTEAMRLSIAAQACILLINMGVPCYPNLRTVIVYEGTYRPRNEARPNTGGQIVHAPGWRLGESWTHGTVVLSWQSTESGASNTTDGHNVVMHEFAHQLDQEDGVADGVPLLRHPSTLRGWGEVLGTHYDKLKKAKKKNRRTLLRKYGATNPAEFFAVATEAFFEKPYYMKKKQPDLYEELKTFYEHDPASWT